MFPFFEISSETCWILQLGYLQSMSQHKSKDLHLKSEVYWCLKAIEYDVELKLDYMNLETFVCERSPFAFNSTCVEGHFTCDHNTCILSVYVCDDVSDCLKGEDEYNCPEYTLICKLCVQRVIHC